MGATDRRRSVKKIDTVTLVTNVLLSIGYVPLSLFALFGVMMYDNPPDHAFADFLLQAGVGLSVFTPLACIMCIAASVAARRQGKGKFAFFIQFLPIIVFAVAIFFMFLSDLVATTAA